MKLEIDGPLFLAITMYLEVSNYVLRVVGNILDFVGAFSLIDRLHLEIWGCLGIY